MKACAFGLLGLLCAGAARAGVIDLSPGLNGSTPITVTGGGLTLTFASVPEGGDFSLVPSVIPSLGPVEIVDALFSSAALRIGFSQPVSVFDAPFATLDAGSALTLTAFEGAVAVATRSVTSVDDGFGSALGTIALSGVTFDSVTLSDPDTSAFAIGNIDLPEPGALALIAPSLACLALLRRSLAQIAAGLLAASSANAQVLPLRTEVVMQQEMVVTANPLASAAGEQVLAAGGNAIDAAIAVEAVLGLVEPQATGIGGGGFMLYYDAATKTVTSFDAREAAPAAATPAYFLNTAGVPLDFSTAVFSGRSFGVPGTVLLWDTVQRRYATKPLGALLQPAIQLATSGFAISPRMASSIDSYKTILALDPNARAYFLNPDGSGKAAGTLLKNPQYASVLARIGFAGPAAFYRGQVARDMVTADLTDNRPGGPGAMAPSDLANYRVIERTPACGPYRGYVVCSMAAPSSGGIAELQILGMLASRPPSPVNSVGSVHLFLQANRLAFADRNVYIADPDYVAVPEAGLIDPAYLASRAALLTDGPIAAGLAPPGAPPGAGASATADPSPPRFGGTSHVSIIDRFGNVVSQTITVESPFGNNRLVDGFILNNELTDFSFDPGPASAPIANRVQGGKRPRSSMSPTIVFTPAGQPAFVAGSPGGSSIIGTTTQAVVAMIDNDLDPQQAANQAHFQNNNTGTTTLESLFSTTIPPGQPGGAPGGTTGQVGPFDVRTLAPALTALGWSIGPAPTVLTSGLNLIKITQAGIEGGSDPRREGIAAGR